MFKLKRISIWLIAVLLCLLAGFCQPGIALAQSSIPLNGQTFSGKSVTIPDWHQVTFGSLPAVRSGGAIPPIPDAGFSGITWKPGQLPAEILTLGSISELSPQALSIQQIEQILGKNLQQVPLNTFPLVGKQPLKQLAQAIPQFGQSQIQDIPPLMELLREKFNLFPVHMTVNDALEKLPELGNASLNQVQDLSQFPISSIPGLMDSPIDKLSDWENEVIVAIPGLDGIPITRFPALAGAEIGGAIMQLDFVWGRAEGVTPVSQQASMSGSRKYGFHVPCLKAGGCAYGEWSDSSSQEFATKGMRWYSGQYQEIDGEGKGWLAGVNGGREPTGRFIEPFPLKIVLWDTDETTDTVSFAFFGRFCFRKFGLHCTPYFIGPIPFTTIHVKDSMLVGALDFAPTSKSSIPTKAASVSPSRKTPSLISTGKAANPDVQLRCLSAGKDNIDLDSLSNQIAAIESGGGNPSAVGPYTCDVAGNCGAALGSYQFMSYNPNAVQLISAHPGGQDFLNRIASGYRPTSEDLMRFFPPEDQNTALLNSLKQYAMTAASEIDPTTNQSFQGERLIERIAQMHFGGLATPIDGLATDALGTSVLSYGQQVGQMYATSGSTCLAENKPPSENETSTDIGNKENKPGKPGKEKPTSTRNAGSSSHSPSSRGKLSSGSTEGLADRIYRSALQLQGIDTSLAPGTAGGTRACAWAVNQVLKNAGVVPVGANPVYVPSLVDGFKTGRAIPIKQTEAVPGNIVVSRGNTHIGICLNNGCTKILSNSSSRRRFSWVSNSSFGGYYDREDNPPYQQYFRLKN